MTKRSRTTIIAVALLAVALIIGVAAVWLMLSGPSKRMIQLPPSAATRAADPQGASATLGIFDLMRQGAMEANMDDETRKTAVAAIDEVHANVRAALDDPSLAAAVRDVRVRESRTLLTDRLSHTHGALFAVDQRAGFIWFELDLLSRRRLLPLMFEHLQMSDAQHKAADAAFMEASIVLRRQPAGGMPNERSMQAMLTGREKLHALLTPQQREQFEQVLKDEQRKRRPPIVRNAPATTRATTAATTSPAR